MKLIFSEHKQAKTARLAAALHEALWDYGNGYFQPLARWPFAQRVLALLLALGAVWSGAACLGAMVDVSGSEAHQQALAVLKQKVAVALQRAGSLPTLSARASALRAGDAPEPVPDNSGLLHLISAAVDKSGVSLASFEPGRAAQEMLPAVGDSGKASVEEMVLHLKAVGTYAHILRFAEALSALSQPIIAIEARLTRTGHDQATMDARLRIIGKPMKKDELSEANNLALSQSGALSDIVDPFGAVDDGAGRSVMGESQAAKVAGEQIAGSFQLEGRRAVLLRKIDGWQLLPLGAPSPALEIKPRSAGIGGVPHQAPPSRKWHRR